MLNHQKVYTPEEIFNLIPEIDDSFILTGMIEIASGQERKQFEEYFQLKGQELNDAFNLYFHWFNIVHELSHIVTNLNGISNNDDMINVETMVNRVASSYWRTFGDPHSYQTLQKLIRDVLNNMKKPIPDGETFESFYARYCDIPDDDMSLYAYFQFSLVHQTLESTSTFMDTLKSYGLEIDTTNLVYKTFYYSDFNIQMQNIINDAISVFKSLGLIVPSVEVYQCTNPNVHCGKTGTV